MLDPKIPRWGRAKDVEVKVKQEAPSTKHQASDLKNRPMVKHPSTKVLCITSVEGNSYGSHRKYQQFQGANYDVAAGIRFPMHTKNNSLKQATVG